MSESEIKSAADEARIAAMQAPPHAFAAVFSKVWLFILLAFLEAVICLFAGYAFGRG